MDLCELNDRVDRPAFLELKEKAKQLGGWYSSFVKGQEGFQFLSEQRAEQFQSLLQGDVNRSEHLAHRKQAKMESAGDRLADLAENLQGEAEDILAADDVRQKNTVRRAEMATGMRGRAYSMQAFARTLRSVAAALSAGDARYLDGLKTKTQLSELICVLRRAKVSRNKVLYEQQKPEDRWDQVNLDGALQERSLELEDADYAVYPWPEVSRHRLQELISKARNKKGLKLLSRRMEKRLPAGDEYTVSFKTSEQVDSLLDYLGGCEQAGIDPVWVRKDLEAYHRLRAANIHTLPELRCAIRELLPHLVTKAKDDSVTKMLDGLRGRKIDGFFPTPRPLVEQMLRQVPIKPGETVLEPSAGIESIADAVRDRYPDAELRTVECNHDLVEVLEAKGHQVHHSDFSSTTNRLM